MKTVAVLGANGQLGKTLSSMSKKCKENLKFYSRDQVDITKILDLENLFFTESFDYCINCAAYTNVEKAELESESAFLVNAIAVKNLAEICKNKKVKLIHISTDYVFDGTSKTPYNTTDATNPINEYGKSKLQGEVFLRETLKEHYIIRTSWLYSAFGKNFVKTILRKAKSEKQLKITTKETGTPTSCIELSKFIYYVIERDNIPFGVYHFTAKGKSTWYEFALEVVGNYNFKKTPKVSAVKNFKIQAKRPEYSVLNISKTENVYGQLLSWQISLKEVLKFLKHSF